MYEHRHVHRMFKTRSTASSFFINFKLLGVSTEVVSCWLSLTSPKTSRLFEDLPQ